MLNTFLYYSIYYYIALSVPPFYMKPRKHRQAEELTTVLQLALEPVFKPKLTLLPLRKERDRRYITKQSLRVFNVFQGAWNAG